MESSPRQFDTLVMLRERLRLRLEYLKEIADRSNMKNCQKIEVAIDSLIGKALKRTFKQKI